MAHPAYLREKARRLRTERKLTIDELAERLALSRSTIYYWVRDLPFDHAGRANAGQRKGNRAMKRKYQLLRTAAYQEGLESFDELASEPRFRDFVCMYIAEGYKRDRNSVAICNSDPAVLLLSVRWLRRLTRKSLSCSIHYHADQDPGKLCAFWTDTLALQPNTIRFQRKSNSGQLKGRTWRCCHGVLAVAVWDTLLRARLQGWIDCLTAEWVQESV